MTHSTARRIAPSLVALLAVAGLAVAGTPTVGQPAPAFRLQDQDGKWQTLAEYKGNSGPRRPASRSNAMRDVGAGLAALLAIGAWALVLSLL